MTNKFIRNPIPFSSNSLDEINQRDALAGSWIPAQSPFDNLKVNPLAKAKTFLREFPVKVSPNKLLTTSDDLDSEMLQTGINNDFSLHLGQLLPFVPKLASFIEICLDISKMYEDGNFTEFPLNPQIKISENLVDSLGNPLSETIKLKSRFWQNDDLAKVFLVLAELGTILKKNPGKLPFACRGLLGNLPGTPFKSREYTCQAPVTNERAKVLKERKEQKLLRRKQSSRSRRKFFMK